VALICFFCTSSTTETTEIEKTDRNSKKGQEKAKQTFLVVGDDALGDRLPDGVNLGNISSSCATNADVNLRELIPTNEKNGFKDFHTENFGAHQLNGASVELDKALTFDNTCNCHSCFLKQDVQKNDERKQVKRTREEETK
jgi:hypothetical protein